MVEARGQRRLPIAFLAVSGQGNQFYTCHVRGVAQPSCQFIAIHLRQAELEDAGAGRYALRAQRVMGAVRNGQPKSDSVLLRHPDVEGKLNGKPAGKPDFPLFAD
jgi:hypothetical protein